MKSLHSFPAAPTRRAIAFALAVITASAVGASALRGQESAFGFDTIFTESGNGAVPSDLSWSADGRQLAYFWEDANIKALWVLNTEDMATRIAGSDGDGDSLEGFHWSPDGSSLLLESSGNLELLDLLSGSATKLTETAAKEEDPKFSPDGQRVAYVREADLWVLDLESGEESRLTTDGVPDLILNGQTDWVYWEELWDRDSTGHWWSPTSDRIAYYRFDDSEVGVYPLLPYAESDSDSGLPEQYPKARMQRYPKAGTTNPSVSVGVVELATGKTTWLDTEADEETYLARVDWIPGGERVAIQRLNRDQNRLELLSCGASDGGCEVVLAETAETWINMTFDLRFLTDGSFLWSSERSGRRQLALHAADGTLELDLGVEGWTVDHVDALVESQKAVVWTGYPTGTLGARHRVIVRQSLVDGSVTMLTEAKRWSSSTVAPATGLAAVVSSTANEPATARLIGLDGKTLGDLSFSAPLYDASKLPQWEHLTIPGPDGVELPAAFLEPADRAEGTKHPAIMYHYGGPASQVVSDAWGRRGRNQWHKLMAMRGYAVLMVDNEASNYFGKTGADRQHRRFGPLNLAAQLAGVRYLESLGYVDTSRIGLWGWSGGGHNTLYSILSSPGTWKAAVAGAPVTNWYFYDTIWTERYLDHPESNRDGYRDSSATTYADKLEDALLIVHGTADDNVHPQNTMVMTENLVASGKAFEQAIHPAQKHGFRGPHSRHFYERMTEFFDRHLR